MDSPFMAAIAGGLAAKGWKALGSVQPEAVVSGGAQSGLAVTSVTD